MASQNTPPASTTTFGAGQFARYGLASLVIASIVNLAVLYGSLAVIDFPAAFVGGPFGPLAVGPVLINSAAAAVGATIVYGLITRFTARPDRTFVVVAAGALLLSFAMFLTPDIADAPAELYLVLGVMHVTTAIVIVAVLTRTPTAEARSR